MAHVRGGDGADSTRKRGNSPYAELTPSQQIRIVLFRECRFKERQLLFDSLSASNESKNKCTDQKGAAGKIGPLVRRNSEEFSLLTDLIFGSTALKYHETYYKIHNISSPQRIIFTQVFIPHRRRSLKKRTGSSLSESGRLQDSFSTSAHDDISSYDSFSIFRRGSKPTPNSTSTTMDSGFSELSLASTSSSQLFENSPRSYEPSDISLDVHNFPKDSCVSYSKLGLALIVAVGTENETYKDKYMQNITFVESILTRLRQYVEIALSTPSYFISVLIDISKDSATWLLHFATFWPQEGPNNCDKKCRGSKTSNKKWSMLTFPKSIFFQQELDEFGEFCNVIEGFETKETNFFLSTLLTTVLTHHTGWVNTCYANLPRLELSSSYHAVWLQLTNVQGSTGVTLSEDYLDILPFELSMKESSVEKFVPELVVQGTSMPETKWKPILKTDLTKRNSERVDEAVAILANTDEWKLQVWSNKKQKSTSDFENCMDSSPLVENMLEVTLQMWKSNMSKQYCETFMEQRLLEICLKASVLAQFLLTTDFCTIDLIVSTLNFSVLDIPLLMSVGSNLYPEVARKYGLSYQ